jgi:hypothetical protein
MAPRKPTRAWGQPRMGDAISTVVVVNMNRTLLSYFPSYQSLLFRDPCQGPCSFVPYGCLHARFPLEGRDHQKDKADGENG